MSRKIINALELEPMGRGLVISVVIMLSLAVLPHAQNIRPEIVLLFFAFASWRILDLFVKPDIANRWVLYVFAAIGFSIAAWYYGPPVGRTPGIAFLIIMLGLKLIEIKTRRDIRVVLILGYFTLITHFLFNAKITTVLPMMGLVFGFTWLMIQMGHVGSKPHRLSDIRLAGKMFVQAIPFAIILFFLFPRLAGSVWGLQVGGPSGISGLSDRMSMGSISELIESSETAFLANFKTNAVPRKDERYWRGEVFWQTDGREWKAGRNTNPAAPRLQSRGRTFEYEMDLRSRTKDWLFALDMPTSVPDGARIQDDYTLSRPKTGNSDNRYTLTSSSDYIASTVSPEILTRALQLPDGVSTPRLTNLVNDLRSSSWNDKEYVDSVMQHFNKNNFVYTLKPPLLTSDKPVDEFMFESQRGFCGHYASSFITMMRMANVPARMVIGYLGGEYNPHANQIVVRQSDAHAWAEVWLQDSGWTRVDPTTAIAPDRIENPIDYSSSANDGIVRFDLGSDNLIANLLRESRWLIDSAQLKWQQWFINFDSEKQRQLLTGLGLGNLNLSTVASLGGLLAIGTLVVIAFVLFSAERKAIDPVQSLYYRFCRKMAKKGVHKNPSEGPRDYLNRLIETFPEQATKIRAVIGLYVNLRYGKNDAGSTRQKLRQLSSAINAV
ncbi:MAG: DUF3488 and transglutaminase-like domain-containing protein [Pseudomonadota bacterium]